MSSIFDLNQDLLKRYKTVIGTIETPSETFYDAYNNFIEQLLKSVCDKENLSYPRGSIISLIDNKIIKEYLISNMNINVSLLNKLKDYALKINKHKHYNEKQLDIEIIISYMTYLYELINSISKYYKFKLWNIKADSYVMSIYNKKGKEKTILTLDLIKKETELVQKKVNDQNNYKLIANTLYKKSKKYIASYLSENEFKIYKIMIPILFFITLVINIVYYVASTNLNPSLLVTLIPLTAIPSIYLAYVVVKTILYKPKMDFKITEWGPISYTISDKGYYMASDSSTLPYSIIKCMVWLHSIFYLFAIFTLYTWVIVCSIIYVIVVIVMFKLIKLFFSSYTITYLYYENNCFLLEPLTGTIHQVVENK